MQRARRGNAIPPSVASHPVAAWCARAPAVRAETSGSRGREAWRFSRRGYAGVGPSVRGRAAPRTSARSARGRARDARRSARESTSLPTPARTRGRHAHSADRAPVDAVYRVGSLLEEPAPHLIPALEPFIEFLGLGKPPTAPPEERLPAARHVLVRSRGEELAFLWREQRADTRLIRAVEPVRLREFDRIGEINVLHTKSLREPRKPPLRPDREFRKLRAFLLPQDRGQHVARRVLTAPRHPAILEGGKQHAIPGAADGTAPLVPASLCERIKDALVAALGVRTLGLEAKSANEAVFLVGGASLALQRLGHEGPDAQERDHPTHHEHRDRDYHRVRDPRPLPSIRPDMRGICE